MLMLQVYCVAVHGILSGNAVDLLNASKITELIITNTLPNEEKQEKCNKIKIVDVAKHLAKAVHIIHQGESISSLFTEECT